MCRRYFSSRQGRFAFAFFSSLAGGPVLGSGALVWKLWVPGGSCGNWSLGS